MKFTQLVATSGIVLLLFGCNSAENKLTVINSESFPEKQVQLDGAMQARLVADTLFIGTDPDVQDQNAWPEKLDEMLNLAEKVQQTKSDSTWSILLSDWDNFRMNTIGDDGLPFHQTHPATDSLQNMESAVLAQKWAGLNKKLLQLSGEVKFADALENVLYEPNIPVLSGKFLKSVIFTHIDDQIFVNVLGSSGIEHHHTTGGTVRLIQKTNFPESNEMTLTCECADTRYLDVYIRIPYWAVNPTVQYGNVKYVPHPGEYCLVSRKWKNGDEITVVLKN